MPLKKGTLYIVSTPIGNLKDITYRAVEILNSVQTIAAEDTRHTKILLNHYDIETKMISYFEHNRGLRIPQIINHLESGNDIASTTSTKVITYTNAFYSSPALGIAAQNMATGDIYTISSKSATGFSIAFTNSSGSGINRTFDYVSQGYGLKSSS